MDFKVGDWVTYKIQDEPIGTVEAFSEDDFIKIKIGENTLFVPSMYLKPWKPQEGEWCWFWDKDTPFPERPFIDKHCGDYCGGSYISETKFSGNSYWDNCEPFIGELPSFIKDK